MQGVSASCQQAPPARFDGYEILRPIGSGGMACVYLARDVGLGRMVALKVGDTRDNPRARARFALEARALGQVQHPNIVAALHAGEIDGLPYLVTEYLPGRALDSVARPLRWRAVLPIAIGLARALDAVHRAGLVHRDVKPSNIMLAANGTVKLIDFGLAGPIEASLEPEIVAFIELAAGSPSVRLTAPDCVVGTPRYLAPELWSGRAATVRSDLYALGLVLHELLAGAVPQEGLRGEALVRYVRAHDLALPLERIGHVPGPLAALIDQCLRRAPDQRPSSAAEVRTRLEVMQR